MENVRYHPYNRGGRIPRDWQFNIAGCNSFSSAVTTFRSVHNSESATIKHKSNMRKFLKGLEASPLYVGECVVATDSAAS